MRTLLCLLAISFLFNACDPDRFQESMADAYVPVYVSAANASLISIEPSRPIVNPGKIYVYGNYLFENDVHKGIHIIDISDRAKPKKLAFLSVPLSTEVAVKGSYLYTNNFDDLLTFDISNPSAPVLVKRVDDVFPAQNQKYPPFTNIAFECPDPSKGVIVRWELKQIQTPKCRR